MAFEVNYEANLWQLWMDINKREYKPSPSIAFIVTKPRRREIFAANFRDRVLHHLIDLKLRPLLEKEFIQETCNNRVGKGTEACVRYIEKFMIECSENYTEDCWICKMDMKGFFMSISKSKLITQITTFVINNYHEPDQEDIIFLLETILSDCPEKECEMRSPLCEWDKLDKNKSLFFIDDDLGIPIGNLISQLLANFYLNEFDHFVKERLGFEFYTRYVDDICIIHKDKKKILEAIPSMRDKLREIGVVLHPDKFYLQHYSKGVEMVGAVVKRRRIYLHNRTVNNAFRAIKKINKLPTTQEGLERAQAVANSYLGFMKHRASYSIRVKLIATLHPKWWFYFQTDSHYRKITLLKKYNRINITKRNLNYGTNRNRPKRKPNLRIKSRSKSQRLQSHPYN